MSFSANKRPFALRTGRIKAPRKSLLTTDSSLDELKLAIGQIHSHNASKLSFQQCYRHAYNIVLSKHAKELYDELVGVISTHLKDVVASDIIPYLADDSFMTRLVAVWNDHIACMSKIRDIFSYMDKVYTRANNILTTWDLGRLLFMRNILLHPLSGGTTILQHTITVILATIERDREGLQINRGLVRRVLEIMYELDDDVAKTKGYSNQSLLAPSVYHTYFQPRFLDASRQFYATESAALAASVDVPVFLERIDARITEEQNRVRGYLFEDTDAPLTDVLNDVLIRAHLDVASNPATGLDAMYDQGRITQLRLMYTLFSRVPEGSPLIETALGRWVERAGDRLNALREETEEVGAGKDNVPRVESELPRIKQEPGVLTIKEEPGVPRIKEEPHEGLPPIKHEPGTNGTHTNTKKPGPAELKTRLGLAWVRHVLDLKDRTDRIFAEAYASGQAFEKRLDDAFKSFVNKNSHASEYISLYIDEHLKRGLRGKTEDEVESVLDKCVAVFRFIVEKDAFERYYNLHLSRRLLHNRSVSEDAERHMLARMRVEAGAAFTKAAEGMMRDMRLSQDLYREYRSHSRGFDVIPVVCSQNCWPFSGKDALGRVPAGLAGGADAFAAYYSQRHSGRKLKWRPDMGSVDVRVRFRARTHELTVSTYAYGVLELFEETDSTPLAYADIRAATAIPDDELRRTLQSLACAKYRILRKEPKGRDVNPTDVFYFNDAFTCPQMKIKIQTVVNRVESATERKDTTEKLSEMRHTLCDACIVRIMKNRKTMSHSDLVHETIEQLASRFQPAPAMVKQSIERLIDKEYLERSETDRRLLRYVA